MPITIDGLRKEIGRLKEGNRLLESDRMELQSWVNDLQAGMYINCVYCGHRYGPDDEVPASMADILKEHIEKCPKHPLFDAKQKIERLQNVIKQKDKELYDIKMGLLTIYKAADKLMTGNVPHNIAWLKETINTLLRREQ